MPAVTVKDITIFYSASYSQLLLPYPVSYLKKLRQDHMFKVCLIASSETAT